MLFTEARFVWFFGLVLAVHWGLRSDRGRKLWLLAASWAFYAAWDWRFLGLILLSTAVDYGCGLAMGRRERGRRRPWLVVSLVANLGLLGFYKYFDFFAASAAELGAWLGLPVHTATLGLVLPVGISFYTFQTMSYALDVHRGRMEPMRDPWDFALFVAFFPQLVAGPIVRAVELRPQLERPRRFERDVEARAMLLLFLGGFVKKACVADGVAEVVDPVFADPAAYGTAAAWIATGLYHVQIYCDFSGYSDMAIATAGLLGYRLPLNFDFPYFARSIGAFWRRWHISLSTWFRDYLYLPLVGRRPGVARRLLAVLATMSLCGLWHGAGWNFVAFGTLHGVFLAVEEGWRSRVPAGSLARRATGVLGPVLTSAVVLLGWPVFRIGGGAETKALFASLFGAGAGGPGTVSADAAWFLAGWLVVHAACYAWSRREHPRRLGTFGFATAYGAAWALVLPFVAAETQPFIYFQF